MIGGGYITLKHKIILDCDPGHDDAIAILLAARHAEIDLLAITTVAGNQSLEKTTRNALKVCSLAGIRDVPIAMGMGRPLVRPAKHAADIHGESGLDGPHIQEPTNYDGATGSNASSPGDRRSNNSLAYRSTSCSDFCC